MFVILNPPPSYKMDKKYPRRNTFMHLFIIAVNPFYYNRLFSPHFFPILVTLILSLVSPALPNLKASPLHMRVQASFFTHTDLCMHPLPALYNTSPSLPCRRCKRPGCAHISSTASASGIHTPLPPPGVPPYNP